MDKRGSLKTLIVGLLLAGLFMIAMINFGLQLSTDNGSNQSIGDDPALIQYSTALEGNLSEAQANANSAETAASNSSVSLTGTLPFIESSPNVLKTVRTIPITIWNLTFGLFLDKIFGGSSGYLVVGIIGACLTIVLVLLFLKFISTGVPD